MLFPFAYHEVSSKAHLRSAYRKAGHRRAISVNTCMFLAQYHYIADGFAMNHSHRRRRKLRMLLKIEFKKREA
jgi:hypothetical protein